MTGVTFLGHTQHGRGPAVAHAVLRHRILGLTVTAGLLRLAELAAGTGTFGWLWPIALLAAALQLVIYREPPGAFEHGHQG